MYDEILEENPVNLLVLKRRVRRGTIIHSFIHLCICVRAAGHKQLIVSTTYLLYRLSCSVRQVAALRSQGKLKAAIEALHEVVRVFPGDAASWLELADLHLGLCDYQAAAFCCEEVLLIKPTSAPVHCRLAETLYTLGELCSDSLTD
jgi:tetratricopeptide (TPR) repeat protein